MTTSATSLHRSKLRSFGLASALALACAMVVSAPGCLDQQGSNPSTECTAGQTDATTPDDCVRKECQGGKFVTVANDTEVPDDANPCTQDTCSDGVPQHTAVNGTMCQLGEGMGQCVSGQCEIPCNDSAECDDKNRCTTDACVGKVCMFTPDPQANPDDMNPCTTDACADGKESHVPAPGATCGTNGTCNDMGVCIGCASDTDCPVDDHCSDWACTDKQCISTPLHEGMPLPPSEQSLGDCKSKVCQSGQIVTIADAADPFNDGNSCTADQCNDMAPVNPPLPALSSCATPNNPTGMGKCDSTGVCLGCSQTLDCRGGPPWHTCDTTVNICFSCSDNAQNGTETDVDCGGECIERCELGQKCLVTSDCQGECDNNVCVDCFDNVKNGTEGDVDCGGICPQKCSTDDSCNVPTDCFHGVCSGGKCAAPSCSDSVQNGNETDVDCGGSCPDCPAGKKCIGGNDCINDCISGICN
ncbi:hypothetical protein [Polyangium jinanense]|uniref:Tryptophan synthase alpha chain n=1 Tax=Polyangium jinanense TaxID=2829994 RepID=A0A9X4AVF1_9BACT|nr:hypothetical protein [Polyangium jinanense]MDC3956591.1 hypothetical protein [Polyangium jinanense]MDC3985626.1 hypothetical protein [Polyangium jinanense]